MLPIVCAVFLQTASQAPFSNPMPVAEINRLAVSPRLDGKIDSEEWDPLTVSDTVKTYFQWEPGMLHVAGKLPLGQDLILSLDRDDDGWLRGSDNLEVRATFKDGKAALSIRQLDGEGREGPHWLNVPGWEKAAAIAATSEVGAWTFEATLQDPGVGLLPIASTTVALRVDAVPDNAPPTDAFLPRAVTSVNLEYDRSAGLPKGLEWKTEVKYRSAAPGDNFHIRHTFKGNDDLKVRRIEMQTEGAAKEFTANLGLPFPGFDRKGRAYVDYDSKLGKGIPLGWCVQRSTVTTADGISGVMESSFRAAPLLDFDTPKETIQAGAENRLQRFSVLLRSNTPNRLHGTLKVVPPNGWHVLSGETRTFVISNRGVSRKTFDLEIPGGVSGAFPMVLRAEIDGAVLEKTEWLHVVPAK